MLRSVVFRIFPFLHIFTFLITCLSFFVYFKVFELLHAYAESSRHFLKKSVWDPKRAKLDQNSDFGHVRTYSWLHKLRNTQGKIYGTYLGNRYIYGIYREYIRNIHKYLWYKMIRNTGAAFGGRPIGSVFLIILYHRYSWIFLISSLYIPFRFLKYVSYISLVCFLIYGVKSRSGHDQITTFGQIFAEPVHRP